MKPSQRGLEGEAASHLEAVGDPEAYGGGTDEPLGIHHQFVGVGRVLLEQVAIPQVEVRMELSGPHRIGDLGSWREPDTVQRTSFLVRQRPMGYLLSGVGSGGRDKKRN